MIPLRAERRTSRFTPTTWLIGCVCVSAMVRLALVPSERAATIVQALAIVPTRLLGVADPGQFATVITSAFLHAGWVHLAGNMLFLAVFGPTVEDHLGWRGFSAVYFAAGITGGLAYAFANPSSSVPLVGASAAIAGVLGAHLILEPRARITTLVPALVIFEVASLPAAFVIALWFALQLASTIAPITAAANEQVAWLAHIAGFATGALLASPIAIRDALRQPRVPRAQRKAEVREGARRAA